jgi:hypothetical protein
MKLVCASQQARSVSQESAETAERRDAVLNRTFSVLTFQSQDLEQVPKS